MKRSFFIRTFISVCTVGLLLSVALSFLFDDYRFYTGVGSEVTVGPNDNRMAFSYHVNGSTFLYTAQMDGSDAKRLTAADDASEAGPVFSPDGEEMLFLSETKPNIMSLYQTDGSGKTGTERLSANNLHIRDAVFSPDGSTIYAIGIRAEDWMAENAETAGGFDIYEFDRESGKKTRLTENNYYIMSHLSISPGGEYVLFNTTENNEEEIQTLALTEEGSVPDAYQQFPDGIYTASLSPDGKKLAYTAVTNAAGSEINQYDLFLFDAGTGQSERLTADSRNVESPAFYHETSKIIYAIDDNWPDQPADYHLQTMDLTTKETTAIEPDIPSIQRHMLLGAAARFFMNSSTTAAFYILLGILVLFQLRHRKAAIYLPACCSVVLSGAAFAMNYFYPWTYQEVVIALGPAASALLLCAVLFGMLGVAAGRMNDK